jgi:tRNA A37 methylthiotransferase MiaB
MTLESDSTVYIETYGCQMNVSDSELMLGKLEASGYRQVNEPDGADVILVNTCAIRDHAEQRVIGRLGEMKEQDESAEHTRSHRLHGTTTRTPDSSSARVT